MNLERLMQDAPASFHAWGTLNAYPRDPLRYIEVLDSVQGMTTPSTMHLLNCAVSYLEGEEAYLEVGTWRGATLIGALLGNRAHGYAIDNEVMTEHNKDEKSSRGVWEENIGRFGLTERSHYITGSVPAIFSSLSLPPVGVYLFDGDKSTARSAYDALVGAVPLLAKYAAIFIDDANTPQIREAAFVFCHRYPKAVKLLDLPTPANCWPSFWNGLIVLGWGVSVEVEI